MKIEKPIWATNDQGYAEPILTIPNLKACIELLVAAHNAAEDKELEAEIAATKEPEPRPEAKPLRYGDMFIHPTINRPYCTDNGKGTFNWVMGTPKGELIRFGNILDLAAHIRSGGTLLMVPKGEIGVALTMDEAKAMDETCFYPNGKPHHDHFRSCMDKLAAALKAKEAKE